MLIAVKNHIKVTLLESEHWWIITQISYKETTFFLRLVYFTPDKDFNYGLALEMLQDSLEDVTTSQEYIPVILGGDWNARVGRVSDPDQNIFSGTNLAPQMENADKTTNARCSPTLTFMDSLGMVILNGRTYSDTPAHFTFSGQGESVNDTIWCSIEGLDLIQDLKVISDIFASDHFPVFLNIWTPELDTEPLNTITDLAPQTRKITWDPSKKEAFVLALDNQDIELKEPQTSQAIYNNLIGAIWTAADSSKMIKKGNGSNTKSHTQSRRKPWFDNQCSTLKNELKEALRTCSTSLFSPEDKIIYTTLKKKYCSTVKNKKEIWDKSILDAFANVSNPRDFWAAVRRFKPQKGQTSNCPTIKQWNSYYAEVYSPRLEPSLALHTSTVPELDREI